MLCNLSGFLKMLAMYGGKFFQEEEVKKPQKSQPSEVAHLSKKERRKRRRIQHLSTRKRERKH